MNRNERNSVCADGKTYNDLYCTRIKRDFVNNETNFMFVNDCDNSWFLLNRSKNDDS